MKQGVIKILFLVICIAELLACNNEGPKYYEAEIPDKFKNNNIVQPSIKLPDSISFPSFEMKNGEEIYIQYVDFGCFTYLRQKVTIRKSRDNYFVSASRYSGGKDTVLISDSVVSSSYARHLRRFSNICKGMVLEQMKHPLWGDEYSTNGKGISLIVKGETFHISLDPHGSSYNLLAEFTTLSRPLLVAKNME